MTREEADLLARARMPSVLSVDRMADAAAVLQMQFLRSVIDNTEPFTRSFSSPEYLPPLRLLPCDMEVIRSHVDETRGIVLATGAAFSVLVEAFCETTNVWVSAASAELAHETADAVRRLAEAEQPKGVAVALWRHDHDRAVRTDRMVIAPEWREVRRNYPGSTRPGLDTLLALSRPPGTARLILWHGDPGTGKTSAAMALMREWSEWCDPVLVTDPERLFEEAHYLVRVMTARYGRSVVGLGGDEPEAPRWKLVVAEDADEYLRSDARRRSGHALGRLLNATDGILGRGLNTLILLTTNDEIGRLHPAVTRPGRCLAHIEFHRFTEPEAQAWLGDAGRAPPGGATLAELFAAWQNSVGIGVGPERLLDDGVYL